MQDHKVSLVSIIIPTYKRAYMLSAAIESVFKQTYPTWQLIIVDDNEPQSEHACKTSYVINEYRKLYPFYNILYLRHEKRKNGAAARNTGIKYATGEYIAFLDDDDLFMPNKIEKQINYIEKSERFAGVYCGREEDGRRIVSDKEGNLTEQLLLLESFIPTSTLMFKKRVFDILGGFNENYYRHQDIEFLIRYFRLFEIGAVKEVLVKIGRNNGENIPKGEALDNIKRIFFQDFATEIDLIESKKPGFKKKVFSNHYSQVFLRHLKTGNIRRAIKILLLSVKTSPFLFMVYSMEYTRIWLLKRFRRILLQ